MKCPTCGMFDGWHWYWCSARRFIGLILAIFIVACNADPNSTDAANDATSIDAAIASDVVSTIDVASDAFDRACEEGYTLYYCNPADSAECRGEPFYFCATQLNDVPCSWTCEVVP